MGAENSRARPIDHCVGSTDFQPPADFDYLDFETTPFAHGSCRETYRGQIFSKETLQTKRNVHIGGGDWVSVDVNEKLVYPCVVKMFKKQHVTQAQM